MWKNKLISCSVLKFDLQLQMKFYPLKVFVSWLSFVGNLIHRKQLWLESIHMTTQQHFTPQVMFTENKTKQNL